MNGLIDQARAHIWEVVHELGQTTQDGQVPRLQVALYHYGDVPFLHKPLLHFSDDLDEVSRVLFAINGGGGEERCGEVIRNAVQQLAWSQHPRDLRLIVIAGNEPFTQGPVDYREAIALARSKDIVVSTIHCGPEAQGVAGKWADGARLGGGTFHNINHNARNFDMQAPQDARIRELNTQLNGTYLAYGAQGREARLRQEAQDLNAGNLGASAYANRALVKSGGQYDNRRWDLVDAVAADGDALAAIPAAELPEALRGLDAAGRQAAVAEMAAKRQALQAELAQVAQERANFVQAEQRRLAAGSGDPSLGEAMVSGLRQLAEAKGYISSPAGAPAPQLEAIP